MERNERPSVNHISPFPFPLAIIITPLFLLILACSSSSEISKGDLTGSVYLDGSDDHSGISVALYDLAYLDTTIVRINHEYPHIGVIINQHTEFDHRQQSPIATSATSADGSFLIDNIPTGVYNVVCSKQGFGFRYLYNVTIADGDNYLTEVRSDPSSRGFRLHCVTPRQDGATKTLEGKSNSISHFTFPISRGDHGSLRSGITLYPELHLSGDVNDNVIVAPFHHLVCDGDVTFIPGSSLEIHPNAVVRIAPGADLKIMGNFKAQGEENNMFWVTSNAGFENAELLIINSQLGTNPNSLNNSKFNIQNSKLFNRDSDIELYNSMSLESIASVSEDLIEWGKWDYANICLLDQVDNLTMQNGVFRNGGEGYHVSNLDEAYCLNLNVYELSFEESGGVSFQQVISGYIKDSIVLKCDNGIFIKNGFVGEIKNNYIGHSINGIHLMWFNGTIQNNNLDNLENDIKFTGCPDNVGTIKINKNEFYSDNGVTQYIVYNSNYHVYPEIKVNENNFFCPTLYLSYYSFYVESLGIDFSHNYYSEVENEIDILNMISNITDNTYDNLIYVPWNLNVNSEAGIK